MNQATEQQAAPRVTPEDIESVIVGEYYFTAHDGVHGTLNATDVLPEALSLLTFCVLVLQNGYTVTGESACVSAANFDAEKGREYAREKAKEKIWALEGYLLKNSIYLDDMNGAPAEDRIY